jgi:hypothetical protein
MAKAIGFVDRVDMLSALRAALPRHRCAAVIIVNDKARVRRPTQSWSNGRIEARITKLKLVKRQMCGRNANPCGNGLTARGVGAADPNALLCWRSRPALRTFSEDAMGESITLTAKDRLKINAILSSSKKTALTGLVMIAIAASWHATSLAQEKPSANVVTVFDHAKLDASFAKAATNGGANLLWSHTSSQGTNNVVTRTRSLDIPCRPEGCFHKGFTAVVYVVSGAATLVLGGDAKATAPDKFGGQVIQGGESHRISKGDVLIVPPDTIHWFKDVESPFYYLEVPVP